MRILLAVMVLVCLTGCASARAIRYEYVNNEPVAVEMMETQGGKVKATFKDGASIEGEPQLDIPEFPPIEIER